MIDAVPEGEVLINQMKEAVHQCDDGFACFLPPETLFGGLQARLRGNHMYWRNVSKLAEDLREGRVDEKERFKYFLVAFVVWGVGIQLLLYSGGGFSGEGLVCAAANLTMAIMGTIVCYRINKSGDNADFVSRMICLSGTSAIKLVCVTTSYFLFFSLVHSLFEEWHGPASFMSVVAREFRVWWSFLPSIFWITAYYSMICWYIARIAESKEARYFFHLFISDLSYGEMALALLGFPGVLIIAFPVYDHVSRFVGHGELARLLAFLVGGLWVALLGYVWVWLRRRSVKHA